MVSSARNFFPYGTIRDGQKEFIDDLGQVFREHKILLAHAPTGLGKTASALAVAIEEAVANKKKVFFLTNRHTQHKIAVDTLKEIKEKTGINVSCVDLVGKRWMCSQEIAGVFGNDFNEYCKAIVEKGECEFYNKIRSKNNLTVEGKFLIKGLEKSEPLHNGELITIGKENTMCSYEIALALAKNAQVLIGDYYYIFNPFIRSNLFAKLELAIEDIILIVDEGHNLPTRIMEMMSNSLTSNLLINGIIEAKKFSYNGLIIWLRELNAILIALAVFNQSEKELLITKDQFVSRVNLLVDYDELARQLELAADEVRKKQKRSYLGGI